MLRCWGGLNRVGQKTPADIGKQHQEGKENRTESNGMPGCRTHGFASPC